ncbi:hypothetical protein [Sulfuriroseicoccus oceanibius]|uniref:Scramblase family protein n=1 Tax=Sulfuriroseicoccus oceanibius TaxID=2707525 RepID=A0A7T7F0W0_9BACT|nr:hypothetical protein [Sulfuriroseicoccus oceanibius]QQL44761.1 hypothetical protein G3M56_012905 [Sulfuriroseicoccus oceanibius]
MNTPPIPSHAAQGSDTAVLDPIPSSPPANPYTSHGTPQGGAAAPAGAFGGQNYLIRRKVFKIFGAAFHIYDAHGQLAFYSKQKAFKLKEDLRIYTDEQMTTEVLTIKARNVIDFGATYDVVDPQSQQMVGSLRRRGMKSILRDEWLILDANEREIGSIKEDSVALALVRRFLTNLVPQAFSGTVGGHAVCRFSQNFNPFVSKIQLDYSMDSQDLLDRRLGIAAAVLLGAIEGRQN